MRVLLLTTLAASPAVADSPKSWDDFRDRVREACLAAVEDADKISIEVNPFGSERFGVALLTVTVGDGADRLVCIVDKATGAVELTAAFAPAKDDGAGPP